MNARKNPPSFVLIEKESGLVVYTKRATGVGSEAIRSCVEQGRRLTAKTGKTYVVFLDISGLPRGAKVSVPMVYALGITEEIGPRTNPDRVRKNIFVFNNPSSGPADRDAARELELYIDNDSQLYHSQFIPIVKNLMLKRRKGIYRNDLAKKLFMYLMDAGARKYVREFGTTGQKIDSMFNRNTRLLAANHFVFAFENEASLGNYDRLIGPVSNPGRVRKNIFVFNNPHDNQIEAAAREVGLLVATWAPGDGVKRYRFFKAKTGDRHADYHQGGALYTANGRTDALKFIRSYGYGSGAYANPLTRTEVARAAKFGRKYIDLGRRSKKHGNTHAASEAYGTAIGMGSAIALFGKGDTKKVGHRIIHRAADAELGVLPNPLLQTVFAANPGSSKTFNEMQDVGKSKYVVNYHDGVKVHRDGSPFFDIAIFRSRTKKDQFVKKLKSLGFTRDSLLNPPISGQWNSLTKRQRLYALMAAGVSEELSGSYAHRLWLMLPGNVRSRIEASWFDSSSRGTTRRRAVPVGANPLTRQESGEVLHAARSDVKFARVFRPGHTRSEKSGQAYARAQVVRRYGPRAAYAPATRIMKRAQDAVGTTMSNPGVRFPKPGTKLTIAEALAFAERLGNRELVKQCHAAMKLQKAANKGAKCVIWKVFPMGSSNKIDNVVALTHYGDSPETMYRPPKGSKKGNHMYRHTWGEKGGKPSVPLLASPDGKMLMMPLEGKKIASDWLRH